LVSSIFGICLSPLERGSMALDVFLASLCQFLLVLEQTGKCSSVAAPGFGYLTAQSSDIIPAGAPFISRMGGAGRLGRRRGLNVFGERRTVGHKDGGCGQQDFVPHSSYSPGLGRRAAQLEECRASRPKICKRNVFQSRVENPRCRYPDFYLLHRDVHAASGAPANEITFAVLAYF